MVVLGSKISGLFGLMKDSVLCILSSVTMALSYETVFILHFGWCYN